MIKYDIKVYEDGDIVVSEDDFNQRHGTNYTIGFNSALSDSAAKGVIGNFFKQMIIDSNHVIRAYAQASDFDVSKSPESQFVRHYRNAIAHNGRWDLHSLKDFPLTWRNQTVTIEKEI